MKDRAKGSNLKSLKSPKRKSDGNGAVAFDYYAAFSRNFVSDLLDELRISPSGLVLDPWNGSGTTTTVAAEKGISAIGLDLNPAMVAISESRLVFSNFARQAELQFRKLRIGKSAYHKPISRNDGLLNWLAPRSVAVFREIQRQFETIATDVTMRLGHEQYRITQRRRVNLFLNAGLCSALRATISGLESTNPTWIALNLASSARARPTIEAIVGSVRTFLAVGLEGLPSASIEQLDRITVGRADSRRLPLPSGLVSTVLTSPPYCTRIDYAVATAPEMYLLQVATQNTFKDLRDQLLGTTSISTFATDYRPRDWGRRSARLLNTIRKHPSKASDTYYIKTFLQYFSGLAASIQELNRVTTSNGTIALVVQDSYYKEVHVDLPAITLEMARALRWQLSKRHDYAIPSTLAASNPRARTYRDNFEAVESVLIFRKPKRKKSN